MNRQIVSVHTPEELDRVLTADRTHRRVALALESLAPPERDAWERRINRYFRACGCGSAAGGLTLAFAIGATLAVVYYDLLFARPLLVTGLGLLGLLAALGLGKAFGLWVARSRLKSTVAALRRRLVPPASPPGDPTRG